MSEQKPPAGAIAWIDLTIPNADEVRDFYTAVAGWQPHPVEMEGYHDYSMAPPGSDAPVAGVCHAKGPNADFPPHWLIYIAVDDLDKSIAECERLGGKVIIGPKEMGGDRYSVIEDPAGAVAALYQKG
jgi:hypothetical protein